MNFFYTLIICLLPSFAFSQLYLQDFESADPFADMTIYGTGGATIVEDPVINDRGLAGTTFWVVDEDMGNRRALTTSRFSSPGTADNFLITPLISIPVTSRYRLSWNAASLGDEYNLDPYKVKISTTGNAKEDFTYTFYTQYVGEPNGSGEFHEILLPESFSGEDVYIAFEANGYDKHMLAIDDIMVKEVSAVDAQMYVLLLDEIVLPGSMEIKGRIKNLGLDTIHSCTITWNDGTEHSEAFDFSVPFNTTKYFSHEIELDAVAGELYDLNVCVQVEGDDNEENNCLPFTISVATQETERLALLELFSSSTCPPCYNMNYTSYEGEGLNGGMADLNANSQTDAEIAVIKYAMDFPGIGDHAYNEDARTRLDYYPEGYVPYILLNGGGTSPLPYYVNLAQDDPAYCEIEANHTAADGLLTVNIDVMPYTNWENAKLHIALLDKEYEYAIWQHPSFSNSETEFHHVMRKMIPSAEGTLIDLETEVSQTYEDSYNYVITAEIPESGSYELHAQSEQEVVVFIQDANGKVINSTISVGEFLGQKEFEKEVSNLSLYPNPATNNAVLEIELSEKSDIQIAIYNATGALIETFSQENNPAGLLQHTINVSKYTSGTYVVKTVINASVNVQRLIVN